MPAHQRHVFGCIGQILVGRPGDLPGAHRRGERQLGGPGVALQTLAALLTHAAALGPLNAARRCVRYAIRPTSMTPRAGRVLRLRHEGGVQAD